MLDIPALATTTLGNALLAGRLVATYVAPEGHITVQFKGWARGKRGITSLDEAERIYIDVPSQNFYNDKVGNINLSTGKVWAERGADPTRVKAAEHILDAAMGRVGLDNILKATYCWRCGSELTDPESIQRGYGPHCYGMVTGSKHQEKVKQIIARVKAAPAPSAPAAPAPEVTITLAKDQTFKLNFGGSRFSDILAAVKAIDGRHFDPTEKVWYIVPEPRAVPGLRALLKLGVTYSIEENVLARLKALGEQYDADHAVRVERTEASRATDADAEVSGLGGELLPFQRGGVAYVRQAPRTFIADEQGLGKTIQALAAVKDNDSFPVLVVCESHVKINWTREVKTWLSLDAEVLQGQTPSDTSADVVVVNYDILSHWADKLIERTWRTVIFDESQKIKNPKAARTKAAVKLAESIPADGLVLLLTGTPILNRPVELLPQLQVLGKLDLFESKGRKGAMKNFKNRYCWDDATQTYNGARNTEELNTILRENCYIRRMKRDVYDELPEIRRSIVPVELTNKTEYNRAARDFEGWLIEQGERVPQDAIWLAQIERLKQLSAEGKFKATVNWIKDFVNGNGDTKLIVYATHINVQQSLVAALPGCCHVLAEDIQKKRHYEQIDRFQSDPEARVIVCSFDAASTGITLTAASNVAFVEFGWTPAGHDQAEARCYGRVNDMHGANAYYLAGLDTIDEKIIRLIDRKRKVVTAATEGEGGGEISILGDLIDEIKEMAR